MLVLSTQFGLYLLLTEIVADSHNLDAEFGMSGFFKNPHGVGLLHIGLAGCAVGFGLSITDSRTQQAPDPA